MTSFTPQPQSSLTPVNFDPFAAGDVVLTAPISESQQEIWTSVRMGDDANCAYNESQSLVLTGNLNVELLRAAVQTLVQRHEALRMTVSPDGTTLCITDFLDLDLPLIDLSVLDETERQTQLKTLLRQAVATPFDLEHGPLLRVEIVRLQSQIHQVIMTAHHIICDGWSWGVMLPELGEIYSAMRQGSEPNLDEPDRFSDYTLQQEANIGSAEEIATEAYWLEQFAGSVPVLDLPTDRPRPALRTFDSAREDLEISAEVVAALKQLGVKSSCSFMTTILAGFEVFLYRLTGQEDIVVGISVAGQSATEMLNLVGHCVNLLPLRSQIDPQQSFGEYLSRRKVAVLDAYDRQEFTFGSLIKKLKLPRDPSRIPLVPVVFNIDRGLETDRLPFDGLTVELFSNPRSYENFELYINATELTDRFVLECQYNTNLFDAATIRQRLAEFETLLAGIVANPDRAIALLPILPESERQLLAQWQQLRSVSTPDRCLHQWFQAKVAENPDAIAVVYETQKLTYQDLDRQANQLAHHLQSVGVAPDVLVGICVERSLEMLVGILGILKAGGAYIPLDPSYPLDRLKYILDDAQVQVLVSQQAILDKLAISAPQVVCLDDKETIAKYPQTTPQSAVTADNLAYVIYTSGSTGKPKGVLVNHHNVVRLFAATQSWYEFSDRDVWTLFHSFAFDFSVWEIWGALLHGGRLVIVPYLVSRSPEEFYDLLAKEGVTVLNQTPSAFYQIVNTEELLGISKQLSLRWVIFGGEALELQRLKPWFDQHGDRQPQLVNMYGITETTVHVTYRPITIADLNGTASAIGTPIPDLQIYLLDAHQQQVPIGVPGEIYVGGSGLARGYLNRPELTAERFIPNPFSDISAVESAPRLYRSGDLARYLPNGDLEYLGRIDNQVKIRGFRIELGEIEGTIAQCPDIRESVVIVREDTPGDRSLVAYILPRGSSDIGSDANSTQVADWRSRWDLLYEAGMQQLSEEGNRDRKLDDSAILKQLTGKDSFQADAQEWLAQTQARIRNLNPDRVLELGCGSGQILLDIAPSCSYYLGTDYAAVAIDELQAYLQTLNPALSQVQVACRAADEFQDIESASFDTVIISSVVQYFPSAEYLHQVLEQSVQATRSGGCIYVADVQSYGLLKAYHTSDQLSRLAPHTSIETLKSIVDTRVRNEDELVVDPGFFYALQASIPAITRVEIKLRQGQIWNETTQFHYDVFLYVNGQESEVIQPTWYDWEDEQFSIEKVTQILVDTQPEYLCLNRIPNARIQMEVQGLRLLEQDNTFTSVADLIQALANIPAGIDPEQLWILGESLDYDVDLRWSEAAVDGYLSAVFTKKSSASVGIIATEDRISIAAPPIWNQYTNTPASKQTNSRQIIPDLRQFLQERLPAYMMPNAFVMLEQMPLTANGKIDRQALPAPETNPIELQDTYVAPRNPVEQQIAEIWAQILGLEKVGIDNNFFELGGHSLLGIQIVARISKAFELKLPLRTLFELPTVANLAQRIASIKWATQAPQIDRVNATATYEEGEL